MTEAFQPNLDFTAAEQVDAREAFVVDLDGYEGPLHVLLALARTQKVDLLKLSITRLAEQYLAFVHEARRRNFSLAADYLVMASWLAYLKSRLLLPRTEKGKGGEMPAEERKAVEAITARPQLKRDVFARGDPQATVIVPSDRIDASLYELMAAYVTQRRREEQRHYNPGQRVEAFALEAARDWLREVLPRLEQWTSLEQVAPARRGEDGPTQASFTASTLSASLELVKEGAMDVKQAEAFAELYLNGMPPSLKLALSITDLAFIAYWIAAALSLVKVIEIPPSLMFADYTVPSVVAWNWSFFPLDLAFSIIGLAAVHASRKGNPIWQPLALISLVLTVVAGGMAVTYWAILRQFDPVWFLPNLLLVIWPLFFIPRLVRNLGRGE